MQPTVRLYQNEDDYWHIRKFLREVSLLNDRHDYSWSLLRWDYWVWHVNMNILQFNLQDVITLWEAQGQIVAMLNPDSRGELPARSWLSWKVFHPDEPEEKYEGWEWYRNVQRVPLYRRDLDNVAVAPDGELAAFCTVWFDDVTRTAVFEPVGTHPNHRKRGLGKAVMTEGLRRAQRLGATLATVSSYDKAAHALYDSMGFTEFDLLEPWIKEW